jgi:hypothetical protein
MKSNRTTLALAGLFLAGLLVLWLVDRAGVPTEAQRRERSGRVLPELIGASEAEIGQVEIVRGEEALRFERRGRDAWQMTRPLDVAADPTILETLVRNLKDLRPSPDAGTITRSGESYGLAPPRVLVRLWRSPTSPGNSDEPPLAALEVGNTIRGQSFVKASGSAGIEVVENKLLAGLDREATEFRELNLMPVPTFQVTGLAIRRGEIQVKAERSASGRWHLTYPVAVLASGPKIESALAACSAVRVVDPPRGFVADNVTDFSPYGLDQPQATIALTSAARPGSPLVLEVGKNVPDHPDRVYVRRADQDDVAWVIARFLSEIPDRSTAFRSQNVTEIDPAAVTDIKIDALGKAFTLYRQREAWELTSPVEEKAETHTVQSLIAQLDGLQTSEFLDASRVPRPELDPPAMTIRVWQQDRRKASSTAGPRDKAEIKAGDSPALTLRIGRHDALKKTLYGRLEGDDVILALPDALLEHLPRNQYAYRDRGVLSINPEQVRKLTLAREGTTTVLEPDPSSSGPNQWRMVKPVPAVADVRSVTQLLAALADLRAEELAGDLESDGKRFGLDAPPWTVSWEIGPVKAPGDKAAKGSRTGWLKVGKPVVSNPGKFYAAVEGRPFVFTLGSPAIPAILAEFHETRVLSFAPEGIRRLVLGLPGRTLSFVRRTQPRGDPSDWSPEPGSNPRGIDLSRFNELIKQLAQLRAGRFLQFEGPIPPKTGLIEPRLLLEVHPAEGKPPQLLRIGASEGPFVLAATGNSREGAVFLLPGAAWEALIQSIGPGDELPENVFAP